MPTYLFRCPECVATFEEKRRFADADLPVVCPTCLGETAVKLVTPIYFYSPGSVPSRASLESVRQTGIAQHVAGCPCCRVHRS